MTEEEALRWLEREHATVDRAAAAVSAQYPRGLNCKRGCNACCVDDIRVHALEAALIRRHHSAALRQAAAVPHAPGKCAFLSAQGECRVYAHRPYVCRTQGLVLRWPAPPDRPKQPEQRAGCELNLPLTGDIRQLPPSACWTVGEFEDRLAAQQWRLDPSMPRVPLRRLFTEMISEETPP